MVLNKVTTSTTFLALWELCKDTLKVSVLRKSAERQRDSLDVLDEVGSDMVCNFDIEGMTRRPHRIRRE